MRKKEREISKGVGGGPHWSDLSPNHDYVPDFPSHSFSFSVLLPANQIIGFVVERGLHGPRQSPHHRNRNRPVASRLLLFRREYAKVDRAW